MATSTATATARPTERTASCLAEFRVEHWGRHAVELTCALDDRTRALAAGEPAVVYLDLPFAAPTDPVPLRLDTRGASSTRGLGRGA